MKGNSTHQQHVGRALSIHHTVTSHLINAFGATLTIVCLVGAIPALAQAQPKPPNILVIMGDDIG
jgi:hypothetical protein